MKCDCGGRFRHIHTEAIPGKWHHLTGEQEDIYDLYQCPLCLEEKIIDYQPINPFEHERKSNI